MFEKEIKFIGDFCLNQVKYLGPHFTFQKITATDLHPAIVRYISAELEFMIYSDRRKLLQNSYFDYSGKEIFEHFKKINLEIKKSKRIAFDDAKKLILQAVSFNANYVVKPSWSLSQLIFNDQDTVNIDELEMMLNYIYYYEHLKNVLLAYLTKRKIVQVSKTEFELILKKIDQELLKSSTEQLIDNGLTSMGDFFNIGGVERNLVSPVAVEILLKEKNLFDHLLKLRKGISGIAKKNYTIDAIKRLIYAAEVIEEKEPEIPVSEIEEENLGELADKHAQDLEKAGADELINLEEEEALLALYEEELKEGPIEEENGFNIDQIKSDDAVNEIETTEETFTDSEEKIAIKPLEEESVNESYDESTGKEIVTEMIQDYFVDETSEKEELQKDDKDAVELPDEKPSTEEAKVEKISSIEDEMLEIFENIDDIDRINKEEFETPAIEPDVKKDLLSDQEREPATPLITEEAEDEIEIVEESVVTEEDSVIQEIESATSPEEMETHENEPSADEDNIEEEMDDEVKIRKKDLFSYLSKKEMKKILRHIFLKDEEDFINTAEKIMECGSYKEASDILKSVFTSYKVSPFSKDAVNFTNAVSNYFRQA
jgi:hypothetical protein